MFLVNSFSDTLENDSEAFYITYVKSGRLNFLTHEPSNQKKINSPHDIAMTTKDPQEYGYWYFTKHPVIQDAFMIYAQSNSIQDQMSNQQPQSVDNGNSNLTNSNCFMTYMEESSHFTCSTEFPGDSGLWSITLTQNLTTQISQYQSEIYEEFTICFFYNQTTCLELDQYSPRMIYVSDRIKPSKMIKYRVFGLDKYLVKVRDDASISNEWRLIKTIPDISANTSLNVSIPYSIKAVATFNQPTSQRGAVKHQLDNYSRYQKPLNNLQQTTVQDQISRDQSQNYTQQHPFYMKNKNKENVLDFSYLVLGIVYVHTGNIVRVAGSIASADPGLFVQPQLLS
eukprot:403368198